MDVKETPGVAQTDDAAPIIPQNIEESSQMTDVDSEVDETEQNLMEGDLATDDDVDKVEVAEADLVIGQYVEVAGRFWPGINKAGGVAKITKTIYDEEEQEWVYNVNYILGGRESNVERRYIKEHDVMGVSRAQHKERHDALLGRCRYCGSFIEDCQHSQEDRSEPADPEPQNSGGMEGGDSRVRSTRTGNRHAASDSLASLVRPDALPSIGHSRDNDSNRMRHNNTAQALLPASSSTAPIATGALCLSTIQENTIYTFHRHVEAGAKQYVQGLLDGTISPDQTFLQPEGWAAASDTPSDIFKTLSETGSIDNMNPLQILELMRLSNKCMDTYQQPLITLQKKMTSLQSTLPAKLSNIDSSDQPPLLSTSLNTDLAAGVDQTSVHEVATAILALSDELEIIKGTVGRAGRDLMDMCSRRWKKLSKVKQGEASTVLYRDGMAIDIVQATMDVDNGDEGKASSTISDDNSSSSANNSTSIVSGSVDTRTLMGKLKGSRKQQRSTYYRFCDSWAMLEDEAKVKLKALETVFEQHMGVTVLDYLIEYADNEANKAEMSEEEEEEDDGDYSLSENDYSDEDWLDEHSTSRSSTRNRDRSEEITTQQRARKDVRKKRKKNKISASNTSSSSSHTETASATDYLEQGRERDNSRGHVLLVDRYEGKVAAAQSLARSSKGSSGHKTSRTTTTSSSATSAARIARDKSHNVSRGMHARRRLSVIDLTTSATSIPADKAGGMDVESSDESDWLASDSDNENYVYTREGASAVRSGSSRSRRAGKHLYRGNREKKGDEGFEKQKGTRSARRGPRRIESGVSSSTSTSTHASEYYPSSDTNKTGKRRRQQHVRLTTTMTRVEQPDLGIMTPAFTVIENTNNRGDRVYLNPLGLHREVRRQVSRISSMFPTEQYPFMGRAADGMVLSKEDYSDRSTHDNGNSTSNYDNNDSDAVREMDESQMDYYEQDVHDTSYSQALEYTDAIQEPSRFNGIDGSKDSRISFPRLLQDTIAPHPVASTRKDNSNSTCSANHSKREQALLLHSMHTLLDEIWSEREGANESACVDYFLNEVFSIAGQTLHKCRLALHSTASSLSTHNQASAFDERSGLGRGGEVKALVRHRQEAVVHLHKALSLLLAVLSQPTLLSGNTLAVLLPPYLHRCKLFEEQCLFCLLEPPSNSDHTSGISSFPAQSWKGTDPGPISNYSLADLLWASWVDSQTHSQVVVGVVIYLQKKTALVVKSTLSFVQNWESLLSAADNTNNGDNGSNASTVLTEQRGLCESGPVLLSCARNLDHQWLSLLQAALMNPSLFQQICTVDYNNEHMVDKPVMALPEDHMDPNEGRTSRPRALLSLWQIMVRSSHSFSTITSSSKRYNWTLLSKILQGYAADILSSSTSTSSSGGTGGINKPVYPFAPLGSIFAFKSSPWMVIQRGLGALLGASGLPNLGQRVGASVYQDNEGSFRSLLQCFDIDGNTCKDGTSASKPPTTSNEGKGRHGGMFTAINASLQQPIRDRFVASHSEGEEGRGRVHADIVANVISLHSVCMLVVKGNHNAASCLPTVPRALTTGYHSNGGSFTACKLPGAWPLLRCMLLHVYNSMHPPASPAVPVSVSPQNLQLCMYYLHRLTTLAGQAGMCWEASHSEGLALLLDLVGLLVTPSSVKVNEDSAIKYIGKEGHCSVEMERWLPWPKGHNDHSGGGMNGKGGWLCMEKISLEILGDIGAVNNDGNGYRNHRAALEGKLHCLLRTLFNDNQVRVPLFFCTDDDDGSKSNTGGYASWLLHMTACLNSALHNILSGGFPQEKQGTALQPTRSKMAVKRLGMSVHKHPCSPMVLLGPVREIFLQRQSDANTVVDSMNQEENLAPSNDPNAGYNGHAGIDVSDDIGDKIVRSYKSEVQHVEDQQRRSCFTAVLVLSALSRTLAVELGSDYYNTSNGGTNSSGPEVLLPLFISLGQADLTHISLDAPQHWMLLWTLALYASHPLPLGRTEGDGKSTAVLCQMLQLLPQVVSNEKAANDAEENNDKSTEAQSGDKKKTGKLFSRHLRRQLLVGLTSGCALLHTLLAELTASTEANTSGGNSNDSSVRSLQSIVPSLLDIISLCMQGGLLHAQIKGPVGAAQYRSDNGIVIIRVLFVVMSTLEQALSIQSISSSVLEMTQAIWSQILALLEPLLETLCCGGGEAEPGYRLEAEILPYLHALLQYNCKNGGNGNSVSHNTPFSFHGDSKPLLGRASINHSLAFTLISAWTSLASATHRVGSVGVSLGALMVYRMWNVLRRLDGDPVLSLPPPLAQYATTTGSSSSNYSVGSKRANLDSPITCWLQVTLLHTVLPLLSYDASSSHSSNGREVRQALVKVWITACSTTVHQQHSTQNTGNTGKLSTTIGLEKLGRGILALISTNGSTCAMLPTSMQQVVNQVLNTRLDTHTTPIRARTHFLMPCLEKALRYLSLCLFQAPKRSVPLIESSMFPLRTALLVLSAEGTEYSQVWREFIGNDVSSCVQLVVENYHSNIDDGSHRELAALGMTDPRQGKLLALTRQFPVFLRAAAQQSYATSHKQWQSLLPLLIGTGNNSKNDDCNGNTEMLLNLTAFALCGISAQQALDTSSNNVSSNTNDSYCESRRLSFLQTVGGVLGSKDGEIRQYIEVIDNRSNSGNGNGGNDVVSSRQVLALQKYLLRSPRSSFSSDAIWQQVTTILVSNRTPQHIITTGNSGSTDQLVGSDTVWDCRSRLIVMTACARQWLKGTSVDRERSHGDVNPEMEADEAAMIMAASLVLVAELLTLLYTPPSSSDNSSTSNQSTVQRRQRIHDVHHLLLLYWYSSGIQKHIAHARDLTSIWADTKALQLYLKVMRLALLPLTASTAMTPRDSVECLTLPVLLVNCYHGLKGHINASKNTSNDGNVGTRDYTTEAGRCECNACCLCVNIDILERLECHCKVVKTCYNAFQTPQEVMSIETEIVGEELKRSMQQVMDSIVSITIPDKR